MWIGGMWIGGCGLGDVDWAMGLAEEWRVKNRWEEREGGIRSLSTRGALLGAFILVTPTRHQSVDIDNRAKKSNQIKVPADTSCDETAKSQSHPANPPFTDLKGRYVCSKTKNKIRHTAIRIRWWSPTQLLTDP
jgi:hypothetical protein